MCYVLTSKLKPTFPQCPHLVFLLARSRYLSFLFLFSFLPFSSSFLSSFPFSSSCFCSCSLLLAPSSSSSPFNSSSHHSPTRGLPYRVTYELSHTYRLES
eukprot:gb/GEZN01036434.1/.p1 GENE.gb/GEZN01036434.1/~~gb/GEZN01036434.1/.p1  ORF type:complete len:100 (+),score=10.75 gb/GEZN01036434.1/:49-348(+)